MAIMSKYDSVSDAKFEEEEMEGLFWPLCTSLGKFGDEGDQKMNACFEAGEKLGPKARVASLFEALFDLLVGDGAEGALLTEEVYNKKNKELELEMPPFPRK